MIFLGIDPGNTGAAFYFDEETKECGVYDLLVRQGTLSVREFDEWLDSLPGSEIVAVIESQFISQSSPAISAMQDLVRMSGNLQTALDSRGILTYLVQPRLWKRHFELDKGRKDDVFDVAIDLFPNVSEFFCLKKHHNRADAAVLSYYARDVYQMLPWSATRLPIFDP